MNTYKLNSKHYKKIPYTWNIIEKSILTVYYTQSIHRQKEEHPIKNKPCSLVHIISSQLHAKYSQSTIKNKND